MTFPTGAGGVSIKVVRAAQRPPAPDRSRDGDGLRDLRIAGVCLGEPRDPHTGSGVPLHLLDALALRADLVARIDARPHGIQRAGLAAWTFRPDHRIWRERFGKHPWAHALQSRNAARAIARIEGGVDCIVQISGLFEARGAPRLVYADWTHALSRRHWPDWSPLTDRMARRRLELERRIYARSAHVFCMSRVAADSLVEDYGVAPSRVSVVGGGVNFAALPPAHEHRREPVVLFVGRDWKRKGGPVLREAFARVRAALPGARLVVIGTAACAPGPGIEVLGKLNDRRRLAAVYHRAGVFCLPSVAEPYGLAAAEAMAYGLPCIVARCGGLPEVVGTAGVVVEPGDPAALAAALLGLLRDPARARRIGAAGRARVEHELTWDRVVDRMLPVLERFGPARSRWRGLARA